MQLTVKARRREKFDPLIEKRRGDDVRVHTPQASNSGRFWKLTPALLIALVIPYVALASAAPQRPAPPTGRAPDFSGLWIEIPPPPGAAASGPPLRMRLTQRGTRMEVRLRGNANPTPNDPVFGVATIQENGSATWTGAESCGPGNQKPGYNYDHPGSSQFTLALEHPIDGCAPPASADVIYANHHVECALRRCSGWYVADDEDTATRRAVAQNGRLQRA